MHDHAPPDDDRRALLREEIANSITHALGFLASVVGLPFLVDAAVTRGEPRHVVGATIFGGALVVMYAASMLYHAVQVPRAKRVLRVVDHTAIYLLIAGTYTPFTLGALYGPVGWSLLATVWTLAAFGIALKLTVGFRYPRLSLGVYLLMGWLAVLAVQPIVERVGTVGASWLLAGGLCYTAGVWFYVRDRLRYRHALWHVCVLGGSVCHFFAVLWHAVPSGSVG
jgi:hemolysin III